MGKQLVPVAKRALRKVERPEAEVELVDPAPKRSPFVSFSYTYTELSSVGGRTQLKSKSTRLEDGKLVSESFDGELERGTYEQALQQAHQHLYDQASLFLRPLSWLLPFTRK
jgi:hypothetical protein